MERIAETSAGLRSLTENIDTMTPIGRIMMQMVGSFTKFERAMNPGTDLSRPVRRPARKGGLVDGVKTWMPSSVTRSPKRRQRPQVWCRYGAALQHETANSITDRRRAPDGAIVAHETHEKPPMPVSKKRRWKTVQTATAKDEDYCG